MPAMIRATHPRAFRYGKWAEIAGTAILPFSGGDRPCYLVVFPDNVTDFWVVDDEAELEDYRYDYEFLMT
jgi:hypothetical protein